MKRAMHVLLLLALSALCAHAQGAADTVALTDGRMLKGTILNRMTDGNLLLRLENGVETEVPYNVIVRINRVGEPSAGGADTELSWNSAEYTPGEKSPGSAALWALLIPSAGHAYAGCGERGLLFLAGEVLAAIVAVNGIDKVTHTYTYSLGVDFPPLGWEKKTYTSKVTTYEFTQGFSIGVAAFSSPSSSLEMMDASEQTAKYNDGLLEKLQQTMSENRIGVDLSIGSGNGPALGCADRIVGAIGAITR
ncbi:MAG: hypothetical protein IPP94_17470 [Ignavibacteria bacterium]|nr:hypothetical protein [Ignavibacteria bacterium]